MHVRDQPAGRDFKSKASRHGNAAGGEPESKVHLAGIGDRPRKQVDRIPIGATRIHRHLLTDRHESLPLALFPEDEIVAFSGIERCFLASKTYIATPTRLIHEKTV